MEYRGVEYVVVRTIPKGWRWSVKRDHNDKAGKSPDRETAVLLAQRFIDKMITARGMSGAASHDTPPSE
jgi:hypothetical protein